MRGDIEYDNLYVTIRRDKAEDCMRCYRSFGWEVFSCEEHRIYYNLLNLSLRRPHKISNKDELQLLQVYLETALNTIGKLERKPRPLTVTIWSLFSVIIAGLIVAGLCFALISTVFTYVVIGWVCVGLGVLFIAPAVLITVRLYRLDGMFAAAGKLAADREIEMVCARAEQLTDGMFVENGYIADLSNDEAEVEAEETDNER